MEQAKRANVFEKFNLELTTGSLELGKTYPLFGIITKIIRERPGEIWVEINRGISARVRMSDPKGVVQLKERLFESGIFVSSVTKLDPDIEVECETIIFGRRPQLQA